MRALEAGSFQSVVCPALIGELERVLRRPKFSNEIHDEDIALFIDFVRSASTGLDDPPASPGLAPDPGDDYLLVLADAADATHVVTGDQALLTVSGWGFKVSSPRQFVREVLESSRPHEDLASVDVGRRQRLVARRSNSHPTASNNPGTSYRESAPSQQPSTTPTADSNPGSGYRP